MLKKIHAPVVGGNVNFSNCSNFSKENKVSCVKVVIQIVSWMWKDAFYKMWRMTLVNELTKVG